VDVDLEKFSSEEDKKQDEENKLGAEESKESAESILQYFTKVLGDLVKSIKISKKLGHIIHSKKIQCHIIHSKKKIIQTVEKDFIVYLVYKNF
jgi:HSP90 family molecular chaperone